MTRRTWPLLLACAALVHGEPLLFTGVDAWALCARAGWSTPSNPVVDEDGFHAESMRVPGQPVDLVLGVHPSVEAAQQSFARLARSYLEHTTPVQAAGPGNEFRAALAVRGETKALMRQDNLVLAVLWCGDLAQLVAGLKAVEALLRSDRKLGPTAAQVPALAMTVVAPCLVAAGRSFEAQYLAPPHEMVRSAAQAACHTQGTLQLKVNELGPHRLNLAFATRGARMITAPLDVLAVAPAELPSEQTVQRWDLPERKLYFIAQPGDKWAAKPESEREWLYLHRSLFRPLRRPELQRLAAWNELAQHAARRWLPLLDQLTVYEDGAQPPGLPVYYAAWRTRGVNFVLQGEVGRQFWLYAEQPAAVAADQALAPADLLRRDIAQPVDLPNGDRLVPRALFGAKVHQRLRSLSPTGPWEPVRIVLAHVQLPAMVDLHLADRP